jgi:hypothetical protein
MSLPAIYWVGALSVLLALAAVLLRGPTRAWRRKRRYRLRAKKSAAFWQNLTVTKSVPDSLRVIATLTTAPDRIHLLEPVLQALISGQSRPPDEIHLNIPYRFGRTGQEYILPGFLDQYPVKVFRGEDEGPGTKLIPTIRRTPADADVWFFIVDDDVRHLPEALATLLDRAQADPLSAYGFADNYLYRRWSQPDGEVDILCGFAGFIVHRSFFKEDFESYLAKALSHASCRFHDDVYFSNYLALHGISRFRIATPKVSLERMELLGCLLEQGGNETSLAMGHGTGENTRVRAHRAMDFLRSVGLAAISPSKS